MRMRPAIVVTALVVAAFGVAFALRAGDGDEPAAFPGKRAATLDVPKSDTSSNELGSAQDIPSLRARKKAKRKAAAPVAAPAPAPAPAPRRTRARRRRSTPRVTTPAPVQVTPAPVVVRPAPRPAPKPQAPSNTGNFDDSG
jgi:hypothetical protein